MERVECPRCNEEFDPTAQGGFCTNPECGKWRYDPDDAGDSTPETSEEETEEQPETTYCPSCGELVEDDNYCTNCSHEFGSVDKTQECLDCNETVPQLNYCRNCADPLETIVNGTDRCPECDASTETDENYCSTCGASLQDSGGGLILEFMGEEFPIEDGTIVGKHLRSAAYATGLEKQEVLKISREHVEFERTPDGFYLIDHGRNETFLNGTALTNADRHRIEPGDEIGFVDVGTATIRTP